MAELPSSPSPGALEAWSRHLVRGFEPEELRRSLADGSLPLAFAAAAATAGDRDALAIAGERVTHAELDDRAARAAGWLRAAGIRPGDRAILSGPNSVAFVVGYLALLRAGAVVVPAGAGLTLHELSRVAGDADPVVALAAGEPLAALRAIESRRAGLRAVISLTPEVGPTLAEAIAEGAPIDPVPTGSGDVALLAYTSGTAGVPKAVPLTHANLLSSIRAVMLAWRWSAEDVLVHALPITHQHGLGGIHATLLAGSRASILPSFEPEELVATIERERASVLFAVPAIYERLLGWEGLDPVRLASLRLRISGSAPLSPLLFARVADAFGAPPLERYGTTESGLDVSNTVVGPPRPGSVGFPLPGIELALVDGAGSPVSAGEDGEIVVRGPQVFSGYLGTPNDDVFLAGEWFRTGDVGQLDSGDGSLSITGRLRDVIITGGMNVHPREVELALEAHPGVREAAVIGAPSDRWGEEVTAFVVPAGPSNRPAPDELIAFARTRLAVYKCPKRVLIVEALPVDSMGKVSRIDLRRPADER